MQTQFFGRGNPPDHLDSIAGEAPIGISSDDGYRIDVISAADAGGGGPGPSIDPTARLVMAVPLADVDSTLNRLTALELLIGLAVAAVVALLAYAIVRREFHPLERMEATADAIAAGDLSRRVDDADPATEVGRLGVALNSMLGQIEQAFAERQASENRLRRFVADASHELKTPLTSVRGFAELFRRGAAGRPGGPGAGHAADRVRSPADGGAGRRPARPGEAGSGSSVRARAGRPGKAAGRAGGRSSAAASGPPDLAAYQRRRVRPRGRAAAAAGGRQPALRTPACIRRRERRSTSGCVPPTRER